jgi:hypothetical protein
MWKVAGFSQYWHFMIDLVGPALYPEHAFATSPARPKAATLRNLVGDLARQRHDRGPRCPRDEKRRKPFSFNR